MKRGGVTEARLARVRTALTKIGFVAYVLLEAEAAASIWRQWSALAWLGLLCVALVGLNLSLNAVAPRLSASQAQRLRVFGNVAILLALCHLTAWSFAALAMLVLIAGAVGATGRDEAVGLVVGIALIGGAVAWVDGAGLLRALTLATAVEGAFWLAFGGARVGSELLEQLEARHLELAAAHAELKRMQQVVVQQDKLAGLGMMAAGVAHEINNPMSFVTSNVVSLLADLRAARGLPAEIREYVDEVLPDTIDGIRRVNGIVADLRRFARSDAADSEPYDLNEQVEHGLRLASNQLKQRCHVVRELGELPELNGRPQQITQILVNLLVNAAQAIAHEGTVTVGTHRVENEVILSVRDTGSGMTPETRQHLFEPFFTTKPVGEGTGLGLAVIHGIVVAHGGTIEVESELGQGSCFTVRLPVEASHPEAEEPLPVALADPAVFGRELVAP